MGRLRFVLWGAQGVSFCIPATLHEARWRARER